MMRYWIVGWAGACVALGVCAIALATVSAAVGPRFGGLQVGMRKAEAETAAGAQLQAVSEAELYVRGVAYKGRPADVWAYREAGFEHIEALRWRQDLLLSPARPIQTRLPALSMPEAPSDEGCTEALERLAGVVKPFDYMVDGESFATRFGEQLALAGFSRAAIDGMLASGQAYAEGFEAADPHTFGCNFVFNAQSSVSGQGFESTAFADVRLDWSQTHARWRMYRMGLQIDVRRVK